ncbi:4'-phosphopantetheinyl transferase family protein [Bradyrhizobium sp. SZCCHNRI1009]|uniref:4'-phosphopantetheinyl transferase family protein n=1 Tax=Bradyrhizobium sp. SZCCHNRI1009 TaxID=3057277 RepID=UPI003966DFB0
MSPCVGCDKATRGLAFGQVDVWLTDLDQIGANELRNYGSIMSSDERARWVRFDVPQPKLQHVVARAPLRTTLSRYANVKPEDWKFDTNTYGRPHITSPTSALDLRFNLSHTEGLVVLAVARDSDVGVDVEKVSRNVDIAQIAPMVFAPAEVVALESSTKSNRRDMFFALWTLEEAYIKARGMELSLTLDSFAFDLSGKRPCVIFNDDCRDDPACWSFERYFPTATHALAVAVAVPRHELNVQLNWTVP